MQKHKKYLVITIWISTIAFVGAGFVGWGAYKFGSGADAIAQVGDTKITYDEYNQKYNTLYAYYNRLFGGTLDQEKAKAMQLDKLALSQAIQEATLLNYAKELGLQVSDEEVAKYIANMKVFWKNGHFDAALYKKILAQNHLRPKIFEKSIRKELLLKKLARAFTPTLYPVEFDAFAAALYMGDKIEYKVLSTDEINVSMTDTEIRTYYDAHKQEYKSPTTYKLSYVSVVPKEENVSDAVLQTYYKKHRLSYTANDGKILPFAQVRDRVAKDYALKNVRKKALKVYIAFKKGTLQPQGHIDVTKRSTLPPKIALQLPNAPQGKVFKPVVQNDTYYIYRLDAVLLPKPLAFEKVKERVKKAVESAKKQKALIKLAQKELKNFHGTITNGYVTRDDIAKIKMPSLQAQKFLRELFIRTQPKGIITLSQNRIALYKILDQKLSMKEKVDKNRARITDNARKHKELLINEKIIEKLQQKYHITIYKGQ